MLVSMSRFQGVKDGNIICNQIGHTPLQNIAIRKIPSSFTKIYATSVDLSIPPYVFLTSRVCAAPPQAAVGAIPLKKKKGKCGMTIYLNVVILGST